MICYLDIDLVSYFTFVVCFFFGYRDSEEKTSIFGIEISR